MTTTPVTQNNAAAEADGGAPAASNTASVTSDMFLKLLVTQLQNQDPTNPTDSSQFLSQLSQITQVEQLVAIRTDMDQLVGLTTSDPAAA
jgi:flagellar basal-body rod modification protein FlgD